jgi:Protein of unknown function (DUF2637)
MSQTDTAKATGNATYVAARLITNGYALGALGLSFSHIVSLGYHVGMGWQSWLAPAFVDGLALLGRMGQSKRFAARTRRAGHRLMLGAGSLSFAANIAAGHTWGTRIFGAMVVIGFVIAEWYASQLAPVAPRAPRTPATPAPAPKTTAKTRRCPAGCTCGKHNRRPSTARIAAEVAAIETIADMRFGEHNAPVSPAPAGSSNFGYL